MALDVAAAVAQLGRRETWVGDDDLVFAGEPSRDLDASALRRRCKESLPPAGLRPLRFHDLRRAFGTRTIAKAEVRRVQESPVRRRRGHPRREEGNCQLRFPGVA